MNNHLFFGCNCKRYFFIISILVFLFFILFNTSQAQTLKNGSLSIESTPRGARVYLDSEYKGDTPLDIRNLPAGQYSIKMNLEGFQDWTTTVIVLPILTVKISAELVAKESDKNGSVSVNSTPQGARVYLDNGYKGNTPINLREVPVGRHTLRITLAGYEEWVSDINVLSSRVERISVDLKPQKEYGSISFNSTPQGADIYLDGDYVGLTPLNLQNIFVGNYTVNILSSGYEEWIDEVAVSAQKTSRVNANLSPRPNYGIISIYCDQKDVKVFLDGTYMKDIVRTPTMLEEIESGDHEIVLIKEGYRAWVGDIEVFIDETSSLDVKMAKLIK